MKKALPIILLALLAIVALVVKRCRSTAATSKKTTKPEKDSFDRNSNLDRRTTFLEYTEHAKCRMECGHITQQTIEYILKNGDIDSASSELNAHPCPVYALQAYTSEKQHLRIIFSQCDYKTKVITCINIDSALTCSCPGVGTKYDH